MVDICLCFFVCTTPNTYLVLLFNGMSPIVCVGCNHHFTHAGYSCHLSMTTHTSCRALYEGHLDHSAVHDSLSVSGPVNNDPGSDSGPEDDNLGEYPC